MHLRPRSLTFRRTSSLLPGLRNIRLQLQFLCVTAKHSCRPAKRREGDHETPEGFYIIDSRNAHSRFHRALHISYPNNNDSRRAEVEGVPPGGQIMIRGIQNNLGWLGPLQHEIDWTDGCIAVTDAEIDEIWNLVPIGTPIEIRQ
ncbi:MAG TPA: L,D-transpeptidase family protein [Edaphobacter sp.]